MNSTHKAEVFVITEVLPHNNADALEVISVGSYTTCVQKGRYKAGDKIVWVLPDSLVDTDKPEFAFLKDPNKDERIVRVKAKKLRGLLSYGLVIPAPDSANVGDDLAGHYDIQHWELPEDTTTSGDNVGAPNIFCPHYDLENYYRYAKEVLIEGEPLHITEKLHGANCSVHFNSKDQQLYVRSRNFFKAESDKSLFWRAVKRSPELIEFCHNNPDVIVYGEAIGDVKGFQYDINKKIIKFRAFDIIKDGKWLDFEEARSFASNIPWVPTLANNVPFDFNALLEYAEGRSTMCEYHVREGCVISVTKERYHFTIGRVKLKLVGTGYFNKH
jgi:RNA ligase (TIGR02306 family)